MGLKKVHEIYTEYSEVNLSAFFLQNCFMKISLYSLEQI